jgi:hypothetical protein
MTLTYSKFYSRDQKYNYERRYNLQSKTDFERGTGETFDRDFYAGKQEQRKVNRSMSSHSSKSEGHRQGHHQHLEGHHNRCELDRGKYYSPHRLHQYRGGEHHHRHHYDYQRYANQGEYEPYYKHGQRKDFERARGKEFNGASDEVSFNNSKSPYRYDHYDNQRRYFDERNKLPADRNRYYDKYRPNLGEREYKEEKKRNARKEEKYPDQSRINPDAEHNKEKAKEIIKEGRK